MNCFMLRFDRKQQNSVKQLSFNKNNNNNNKKKHTWERKFQKFPRRKF